MLRVQQNEKIVPKTFFDAIYFGNRKNYTHANIKQPTSLANIEVEEDWE